MNEEEKNLINDLKIIKQAYIEDELLGYASVIKKAIDKIEIQQNEIESLNNKIEMQKDIIQDYKDNLKEAFENRDRWE